MKTIIENYIRAAYPILAVNTKEEETTLSIIEEIAEDMKRDSILGEEEV